MEKTESKNNKEQKIKKNDFVEIEFTAKIKDTGEIFDTNKEEEAKKINVDLKENKPTIICLGHEMFLKSVEDFLIGKKIGENYNIELSPEKAFGKRNPSLIKTMPIKVFKEHNVNPYPGAMFSMDGMIVKIISVSGGRVIADFNNPIAGKTVIYEIKTKKKIIDLKEKINALILFFFKKQIDFDIDKNNQKIILKTKEQIQPFIKVFNDKFKTILNMDLAIESTEKNQNNQNNNTKKSQ